MTGSQISRRVEQQAKSRWWRTTGGAGQQAMREGCGATGGWGSGQRATGAQRGLQRATGAQIRVQSY